MQFVYDYFGKTRLQTFLQSFLMQPGGATDETVKVAKSFLLLLLRKLTWSTGGILLSERALFWIKFREAVWEENDSCTGAHRSHPLGSSAFWADAEFVLDLLLLVKSPR